MQIVPTNVRASEWRRATKTKPVKAKPLINLLVDRTVLNKFLVDTLEGKEPLGDGVVICIGESNDAWQQTPKKLLQKYDVKGIDADGWMLCEPRPDNAVKCVQITSSIIHAYGTPPPHDDMYKAHDFYVCGLWGADVPGFGKNIQWGDRGDYVCQNDTDPTDIWIVKRKIFENTYSIKD